MTAEPLGSTFSKTAIQVRVSLIACQGSLIASEWARAARECLVERCGGRVAFEIRCEMGAAEAGNMLSCTFAGPANVTFCAFRHPVCNSTIATRQVFVISLGAWSELDQLQVG